LSRDPVVAEEFKLIQALSDEKVENELMFSGVKVNAGMNVMEQRLLLVEYRLMKSGRMVSTSVTVLLRRC
jgi:hypothetical protein